MDRRVTGEPRRVRPARCPVCGLPYDAAARARIEARLHEKGLSWTFCPGCGELTCRELQRLCAEEAERAKEAG